MGWTETRASIYKNGKVDRKAECDMLCTFENEKVTSRVLKSSMVSTTYYGAIEQIRDGEREVFAAVILTSGSLCGSHYFNFSYKEMTEHYGPCERDCPVSILKLLTPTDSEWANEWRQKCYMNAEKKKAERKNPNSLNNLPVDSTISFTAGFTSPNAGINKGDTVKLTKISWGGKIIWYGYGYKWSKKLIPTDYQVLYS